MPIPIQSIDRALRALDFLAEQDLAGQGAALQAVAARLALRPSTAHNILKTLVACGYAARSDKGMYILGPRCRELTRAARLVSDLLPAATGVLQALAERVGESVVLVTLLHGRRQPLVRVEGNQAIRVAPSFQEAERFFDMVTGRVLAAYASAVELQEILAVHGLPADAWDGIASAAKLDQALAAVRQRGWAADRPHGGQVHALAVPVLARDGTLVGALGVYLPAFRATATRSRELRRLLAAAAARLVAEK